MLAQEPLCDRLWAAAVGGRVGVYNVIVREVDVPGTVTQYCMTRLRDRVWYGLFDELIGACDPTGILSNNREWL